MTERRLWARGTRFAISTPHEDATAAGIAAVDAGGNAVDAALSAATTLAVAAPHMCGVGGDLFAIVREPTGRVVVLNASGAAPRAIDPDEVRGTHRRMPEFGPLTVTVPGVVSGWWRLAQAWSARGFGAALEAAIPVAEDGVAVSRSLARDLAAEWPRLRSDPGLVDVFGVDGRPLAEGEVLVQRALATSLRSIADEGPEAIYGGAVGRRLAEHLERLGSPMRLADLAEHEPELEVPLTLRARGLDLSVPPPNSQGFVLLQILALTERLGIDPDPLGADAGTLAEIFRVSAVGRDRSNADPRPAGIPVEDLLGEVHLGALAAAVGAPVAGPTPERRGDTVALVAADASGLAITLIQSLADGFGSGILEPRSGIVLHNRGSAFVLDPSHPNALAGGRRPAHTLLPVVVQRDGRLVALAGTMGGGAQPQIDAMTLLRAFDLGMDPAAAVAAPRWLVGGMSLGVRDRVAVAEGSVPASTRRTLQEAGYEVEVLGHLDDAVGHAHLLRVGPEGAMEAGSDPRADGGAAAR